jgi:hypothetical protein
MRRPQICLSAFLLTLCLVTPVTAKPKLTVEGLLERNRIANEALQDVQAQAVLNLDILLGILPYTEHLNGRYYYLNPNKHRLEFDDAPSYFDKAPSMFNWNLPSLEKYRAEAVGPLESPQGEVYLLRFRPKNPETSTQSVTCTFDAQKWIILKHQTAYRDGGSVGLNFAYLEDTRLPILNRVTAMVAIPAYALTGHAVISFSNQTTNVGIDPSIFEQAPVE